MMKAGWHWQEYGAELIGTAFLVFVGLSAVVLDFGIGSPVAAAFPSVRLRLLLTGLLFAGSGSLVAISPLGKLSGGHINPAVSFAFWLQGKLKLLDLFGYAIAQCLGGIVGAFLLHLVWQTHAVSVHNGMTIPDVKYPLWIVCGAEILSTALLILVIFLCVSSHRWHQFTPLVTWLLVATLVCLESPISGTSLNPARSLGPAFITNLWTNQWIYIICPVLGAIIAVLAYRAFIDPYERMLTAKLFHSSQYRSIFQHVHLPHKNEIEP